jgi:hypothetical protein
MLKNTFISKGIPVILGEYAVNIQTDGYLKDMESRIKWMTAVTQVCIDMGICPVLWDTGYRDNNVGMADVEREPPYAVSEELDAMLKRIKFPN